MHASPKTAAIVPAPALQALAAAIEQVNALVLGKPREVRLAFTALLAGGHLLVEDLPGLGKTTLARALAATLGLEFQRMQFTADLLPSDILGVSVYDQNDRGFRFHPGPLFTQLLLADEINRAPPRTQSALLEAMAEHQVSVDGISHRLPAPFFVIATQNPVDLSGTFPLPDSQMDRFLLRISMGYPDSEAERAMLAGRDRRLMINETLPRLGAEDVLALQKAVENVHASDALLDYVQRLLAASRRQPGVRVGLSPRAGLALLRGARAHALLQGRAHVLPDDVQALFVAVAAHRLVVEAESGGGGAAAQALLAAVAVD
ncbi:MoxR family ATPase [Silanimonas sp.]|uniref:AAA family ATPase n=1 Tax=Silanimonas sp. TaxID=1929290 RepID=UPI001BC0A6C4|nr:MoxR family ATPase [Silanimonas sp.]MBS3895586.1 MoxR family ATPase [Silanimonas sp.]MBS3924331.1 MoxR family ATPase [Xanthomonadaceae bacterium]